MWPTIAEWFGLEPGPPLKIPLAVLMPKHEDTWRAVQQEHDTKVQPAPLLALPCVLYNSNGPQQATHLCIQVSGVWYCHQRSVLLVRPLMLYNACEHARGRMKVTDALKVTTVSLCRSGCP